MKLSHALCCAATAVALIALPGCAVTREQQTVGAYIDDATITTQVKAKMVDSAAVEASSISVETLNGTVLLSGFAKSEAERAAAESAAHAVKGVRSVKNAVVVRG